LRTRLGMPGDGPGIAGILRFKAAAAAAIEPASRFEQ